MLRFAYWRTELVEGFRFVIAHPMLRILVLVTGFWNFFAEMAVIALVLHVQENLSAGATTYGLILAVGAVGGVVGGMVVAPLLKAFSTGMLAQWMNLAAAPMFLLIAFASWGTRTHCRSATVALGGMASNKTFNQ